MKIHGALQVFWGQSHANAQEQNLPTLTRTAKNVNFVSIIFCKGRHDQPRLSISSSCLWSKFFVSCYSSAPQVFKHHTPFTSCLNYMHPHHKTEWLKVCPHRSWPRQLLIRMWRIQPHPENGRGHKVGQTGWHWQACESEHKGEMKILLTARWAWRQQGA